MRPHNHIYRKRQAFRTSEAIFSSRSYARITWETPETFKSCACSHVRQINYTGLNYLITARRNKFQGIETFRKKKNSYKGNGKNVQTLRLTWTQTDESSATKSIGKTETQSKFRSNQWFKETPVNETESDGINNIPTDVDSNRWIPNQSEKRKKNNQFTGLTGRCRCSREM